MSIPINVIIFPDQRIGAGVSTKLIEALINDDFFNDQPFYFKEILYPSFFSTLNCFSLEKMLSKKISNIQKISFSRDVFLFSDGLNKNSVLTRDLFYDIGSPLQECNIGVYYLQDSLKFRDTLKLDFFSETLPKTTTIYNTDFYIIMYGATAPYTKMVADSLFYRKLSTVCKMHIHERNI